MSTAVATVQNGTAELSIMEQVIVKGDLSKLSPEERATYYGEVCRSMGINPLTKPFEYLSLNGKLTLYATRTCADQLRKINGVSLHVVSAETTADGLRCVTVQASDKSGRTDEEIGVVNVKGLQGEALANAYMKAMTKAKRRATLSVCGLGWLDETEVESIPGARIVSGPEIVVTDAGPVDAETGEIVEVDDGNQDQPELARVVFADRLAAAESVGELNEIARDIRNAVVGNRLTTKEREDLLKLYESQKAMLGGESGQTALMAAK